MDPKRCRDLLHQCDDLERSLDKVAFPRNARKFDTQVADVSRTIAHTTNLLEADDGGQAFCPSNRPCANRFVATLAQIPNPRKPPKPQRQVRFLGPPS